MQKNDFTKGIVIGSALFAMFFGAGNMIFPPYIGFMAAREWGWGFAGYFIMDVALACAAIIAQMRCGSFEEMTHPLGAVFSKIIMVVIVLCLGPVISIPRTAATTFELSVQPLFQGVNMPLFYMMFFLVVFLLCMSESSVVDNVGKLLTPMLFAGLLFIIIKGVLPGEGKALEIGKIMSPFAEGIEAGYQSMDALASTIFAFLIINSARKKSSGEKSEKRITLIACAAASAGLFIVYMGLTYLGAMFSDVYSEQITRTALLERIVRNIIPGQFGIVFFSVVCALACLSTAIALSAAAAKYISSFTKGKVGYRMSAALVCAVSAFISTIGVEALVELAAPLLSLVYPPVIVVILLSFIKIPDKALRLCVITSTVTGALGTLYEMGIKLFPMDALPLAELGLGWVVPTAVCLILLMLQKKYSFNIFG